MKKIFGTTFFLFCVIGGLLSGTAMADISAKEVAVAVQNALVQSEAAFKQVLKEDPSKIAFVKQGIIVDPQSVQMELAEVGDEGDLTVPVTINYLHVKMAGGYPNVGYVTRTYLITLSPSQNGGYYVSASQTDSVPQYSGYTRFKGKIRTYRDAFNASR